MRLVTKYKYHNYSPGTISSLNIGAFMPGVSMTVLTNSANFTGSSVMESLGLLKKLVTPLDCDLVSVKMLFELIVDG